MESITGVCRFCQQTKLIEVPAEFTPEEIVEEVTRTCKCKEAIAYQRKIAREEEIESAKLSASGTTFELFHEDFPEIERLFNGSINDLVNEKIKKVSITTYGKTKATISYINGAIKVEREEKDKKSRETVI